MYHLLQAVELGASDGFILCDCDEAAEGVEAHVKGAGIAVLIDGPLAARTHGGRAHVSERRCANKQNIEARAGLPWAHNLVVSA